MRCEGIWVWVIGSSKGGSRSAIHRVPRGSTIFLAGPPLHCPLLLDAAGSGAENNPPANSRRPRRRNAAAASNPGASQHTSQQLFTRPSQKKRPEASGGLDMSDSNNNQESMDPVTATTNGTDATTTVGTFATEGADSTAAAAASTSAVDDSRWANRNGFGQGVEKSSGKFTKEESELVRAAVQEYCAVKQVSIARLCSECDHKADLKGAWMEISRRLPHRSVQSVYRHGLRQLHPFKRGAWTEEECEMLMDLVARMGKKWVAVQNKLNRSSDSCRDKYREMGDMYVRGRWKEHETEEFLQLIRDHVKAPSTADIQELSERIVRDRIVIPFGIISKKMGQRSRLSCFKKWQKMAAAAGVASSSKRRSANSNNNLQATNTAAGAANGSARKQEDGAIRVIGRPTRGGGTETTNDPDVAVKTETASSQLDEEVVLLSEMVELGVSREAEIDWSDLTVENAESRWHELFEEWQTNVEDENVLSLPISELAQLILEKKVSSTREG